MRPSFVWPALLGALALFTNAGAVFAQSSTATLSGTVQDEQEGVIPSATVTLVDPDKGFRRQAVTGANGVFVFSQLSPSTYELTVEKRQFASVRYDRIVMNANDRRSLRITLQVAGQDQAVTVTAQAPLIREAPAVATAVDQAFIENQPLNGRSFQTLINLSPGVVLASASLPSMGQFSVNGQRTGSNYFTVDGVSANFGLPFATSPYEGSGGGIPSFSAVGTTAALASVDAVQEFTIETSSYAPEYGRQPGAQVAVVTRSGTNEIHGNVFNYLRNDKLDANNWFGNANGLERPALRQNDFGFTVGGPIFVPKLYDGRNQTFFFVSYEGLRLRQPVVSPESRVPSMEARESATGMLKSILEAYPLPVADPLPDTPAETPYVAAFSNPSSLDAASVRLDHALTPRVSLFGRFNDSPSEVRERARYVTPSFVAVLPSKTITATAGSTFIFSAAVTNDLRFNWSRSRASQIYIQDTFGGAKLLPPELVFPPFADPDTSLYYLSIGGLDENTVSPGTFSNNTQNQINIVDTLSWNAAAHSLKFGVDYRRLAPSLGGRFFSNTLFVDTITDLITGIIPSGTTAQIDRYLRPRYHNASAYFQDAWRLNPRLTLTYGLRWEVNPAPSGDASDIPLTVEGLDNLSTGTLAAPGTPLYETTYGNFAPRVGVAYQPFRGRGAVIRAGFGVFYDLGYAYTGTALSPTNFPFSRTRTVRNRPIDDPIFFAEVPPQNIAPPYPRLFAYYDGYSLPYTLQYNLAVEQPFGNTNSFSISYVGAAARRLARVESLRSQVLQNPDFTRIDAVSNEASSDYNSLQLQFKRRMSRGLQAMASYTWSKSLDNASDESLLNFSAPARSLDPDTDRGRSTFDIRHAFTASATYEVPSPQSNRVARAILGGFAFDTVIRLRTASPVTVVTGRDALNLGLTNVARPDLVPGEPLYLYGDNYPGGKAFNRSAFDGATPLAERRQGTLGRGTLEGFGLRQLDLSCRRRFPIQERLALQFRVDAFNLFNTPNFANPVGVMSSGNFGRSTTIWSSSIGGMNPLYQVGGPRSLQLALKLEF